MSDSSVKWFLDKESKIPLYLQIKDLVKYYISTGAIQDNTVLPGVNALARELAVNFETVRKAYKELEKEGLLSMSRGKRTTATLSKTTPGETSSLLALELDPGAALKRAVRKFLQAGKTLEEVRKVVDQVLQDVSAERQQEFLVFVECNPLQVKEISKLLEDFLRLKVRPALVQDLRAVLDALGPEKDKLLAIVTTGFHLNEIRHLVRDLPVDVQVLITNMSPETRRALSAFGPEAKFGFICRDRESIPLYKDLIRAELGQSIHLTSAVLGDHEKVVGILGSVDSCLVTPPVFEDIKMEAPPGLPVFNVFDRVDPMSLHLIRDRLLSKA